MAEFSESKLWQKTKLVVPKISLIGLPHPTAEVWTSIVSSSGKPLHQKPRILDDLPIITTNSLWSKAVVKKRKTSFALMWLGDQESSSPSLSSENIQIFSTTSKLWTRLEPIHSKISFGLRQPTAEAWTSIVSNSGKTMYQKPRLINGLPTLTTNSLWSKELVEKSRTSTTLMWLGDQESSSPSLSSENIQIFSTTSKLWTRLEPIHSKISFGLRQPTAEVWTSIVSNSGKTMYQKPRLINGLPTLTTNSLWSKELVEKSRTSTTLMWSSSN
ncbi:hypothetical protein K3495_g12227 [Podosphaera aphanis]|nr:hypothetical protein K3495_g12227 [Podosphaera aphanis]